MQRTAIAVLITLAMTVTRIMAADSPPTSPTDAPRMEPAKVILWLTQWTQNISGDERNRYCDKSMGEDIGWLVTPFLNGFYFGYRATGDVVWVDRFVDWTDSTIKRYVVEPDGYLGLPAPSAAGTDVDKLNGFKADSFLGDAMFFRAVVLMSVEIRKNPALAAKYASKADSYLKLAEQIYDKWDKRGAWRTTANGQIGVVLPFGIDDSTKSWTPDFATRNDKGHGFSLPDNKANAIACWMLAMFDATGKAIYKERAEGWFAEMKSRLKPKADGTYEMWNYWQPAGQWDYKPDGSTKHWVGVHPNDGYYDIDTEAITFAYAHGVVFTKADIDRLAATALANNRTWHALAPFNPEIRAKFEASHKPNSWAGLAVTPWYLALQRPITEK